MRSPLLPSFATLILLGSLLLATPAVAGQPAAVPQIAYQGRLLDNTLPVTGLRGFVFQILDGSATVLWNSGTVQMSVDNGLYSVVLGSAATTIAGGMKILGRTAYWVGSKGTFMIPATVGADGTSTSVPFNSAGIDNPDCMASAGAMGGWLLTPISNTALGLPATIKAPLSLQ